MTNTCVRARACVCLGSERISYIYVIFMNDNALIQRGERDLRSALDRRTRINDGGRGANQSVVGLIN